VGRRFKGAWPKPLKRLYGQQTVLGYTVDMLHRLGLDITIVIGHRAADYLPYFGNQATFVYNRNYELHEWMTSVMCAARLIPEQHFLLGCADSLVNIATLSVLMDAPDSVLLVKCTPEEGYYRVRVKDGKMLETEPEPGRGDGEWPNLAWGSWGHVGPLARSNLFALGSRVIRDELPAHMFNGCTVVGGVSYNINTLEDLEVARKAFQGAQISVKGES